MATELESKIAALRQRADQARQQRAQAEHQQTQAKAVLSQVVQDMQAEFGVGTVEEAAALLARLDAAAAAEVAAVEQALAATGSPGA